MVDVQPLAPEPDVPLVDDEPERKSSILWMPPLTLFLWISACVIPCLIASFYFAPESWNIAQILFAGIMGGLWCFFCLFINRILIAAL